MCREQTYSLLSADQVALTQNLRAIDNVTSTTVFADAAAPLPAFANSVASLPDLKYVWHWCLL